MMATRKKRKFILGSNKYKHKAISLKLIKKIKRLQKEMESKNNLKPGTIPFVWITDNIDVRLKNEIK